MQGNTVGQLTLVARLNGAYREARVAAESPHGGRLIITNTTASAFVNASALENSTPSQEIKDITLPLPSGVVGFATNSSIEGDGFLFGEYSLVTGPPLRLIRFSYSEPEPTVPLMLATPGTRHFHSVQWDPITKAMYATTGDSSSQVRVFRSTDDGRSWIQIANGSQLYRTLGLVFTPDNLFWATDGYINNNSVLVEATRTDIEHPHIVAVLSDSMVAYGASLIQIDGKNEIVIGLRDEHPNSRNLTIPILVYDLASHCLSTLTTLRQDPNALGTPGVVSLSNFPEGTNLSLYLLADGISPGSTYSGIQLDIGPTNSTSSEGTSPTGTTSTLK